MSRPFFGRSFAPREPLHRRNGKIRARLTVRAGLSDQELQDLALKDQGVRAHTDGKTIRKVVVAKGPLVSVVVQ